MNFWDTIKEVSAESVRKEAARLFVLALAGDAEDVAAAREYALGTATPEERVLAETYLLPASPPYSPALEQRLRHADLLVSLPGGPALTEFRPADTLVIEHPAELIPHVLAHRVDLAIPLARRLPGFRSLAAEQVIRSVSRVNAEFAAIAGIPSVLPILAPLFPAGAMADVVVLTKNQALMMFRLAAIYGEDLALKARVREVLPVIGGAFGWRSLARQILGVVPGGVGIGVRAAIAYSATYATGRVAQMAFDEGRRPSQREMRRIYEDAALQARGVMESLRHGKNKELPAELKALSDGAAGPDTEEEPQTPAAPLPNAAASGASAASEHPAEEKPTPAG